MKQLFDNLTWRFLRAFLSYSPQDARGLYEDGLDWLIEIMARPWKIFNFLQSLKNFSFLPLPTTYDLLPTASWQNALKAYRYILKCYGYDLIAYPYPLKAYRYALTSVVSSQ